MATTTSSIDQINLSENIQIPTQDSQPKQPGRFVGALGKVAGVASNIFLPGAGGIFGDLLRGMGVGALGSDPVQYLRLQQRIQAESRAYEAVSSVLKAKHDAAMDSLRNIAH
ncbi:MAG: hypothetical protein JO097_18160 [Acidobacteriaceae bacterium]|nr:hypothetical protein [Acidobacteriaceae bacterium]MBV9767598.1 hypothetical protein [Acidobacteriaceae bacterium]